MSELPVGVLPAAVPVARDSAAAIVLRATDGNGWEVLLGLRSHRARFMPGHLSFPGGGLEAADHPGEPGAYRRCVGRELREEADIDIPDEAWIDAGERITPPIFAIRFRNRFFVAGWPKRRSHDKLVPASGENEDLRLACPAAVLREWAAGTVRLPPPVLPILRALAATKDRSLADVARRVVEVNAQEERAPRIEFVPDLWMLPMRTATMPPASHTNAWLPGARRFVIVDPGSDDEREVARLLEVVARRSTHGSRPAAVLLTHHHRDHVSGAGAVARALGIPVRAHAATLDVLGPLLQGLECSAVADDETLDLDGTTLVALHTPGHAAGHLVFHDPERELLVAGDLISGLSTILIDPDEGDMDAYLTSLARVQRLACRLLLPGHGPPLPAKRLGRLIEHRRQREARILEALAAGTMALEAIAATAYAETPGLPVALTSGQTRSHLIRLERHGQVRRADAPGRRWRRGGGAS